MGMAGNDGPQRPKVCPQVYADRNKTQRLMASQPGSLPAGFLSSPTSAQDAGPGLQCPY